MCYWYLQGPSDHAYRYVQYVSIYKYNIHIWFLYVLYYIRKKFFVIYQYHIYLSPNQRKCYIRCALGCPQQRWPSAGVHGCCCDERYNPTFPEWWVVQHLTSVQIWRGFKDVSRIAKLEVSETCQNKCWSKSEGIAHNQEIQRGLEATSMPMDPFIPKSHVPGDHPRTWGSHWDHGIWHGGCKQPPNRRWPPKANSYVFDVWRRYLWQVMWLSVCQWVHMFSFFIRCW